MQIPEVPKLPHSNTASQDCFEMWKEHNKTVKTFSQWHLQEKYKEKSVKKKKKKLHRKRGRKEEREGGREEEHEKERELISSQKNCKGNTRPHLSTCASKGYGERRW